MIARALVAAVALAMVPAGAAAQAVRAEPLPGRIEISAGPVFGSAVTFGSRDALEPSNGSGTYRLFSTATQLAPAAGAEIRVGTRLSRRVDVEGFASYSRPQLRTAISADAEGAPSLTAREIIQQVAVGASLSFAVMAPRRGRVLPFVTAGAAYLRELHDGLTLLQTGRRYDAGGGVRIVLRAAAAGRVKLAGIRLDARALVRTRGVAFDSRAHVAPQVGAALFVRF